MNLHGFVLISIMFLLCHLLSSSSAVPDVHSRAQCAHAHRGVLVAKVCTLLEVIFQVCTLFLRVLEESAHIFEGHRGECTYF